MKYNDLLLIEKARCILEDVTPFTYDCGLLCGKRCCGGSETEGMWLLPGEEALLDESYTVREAEDGQKYAVCSGRCDRTTRPFSCRIFPLFPLLRQDERGEHLRAVTDPRAGSVCPIAAHEMKTSLRFRFAVSRAGRILRRSENLRLWLAESSALLDEIVQLQKLLGR